MQEGTEEPKIEQFTHEERIKLFSQRRNEALGIKADAKPEEGTKPAEGEKPTKDTTELKVENVGEKTDAFDYKAEYEKLKAEKEKVTQDKPVNPYKNKDYYRLEKIEEKSPNEVKLYQRLLFGATDPVELWKIGFIKDNPEYSDKPEVVQRLLERKYPGLLSEDIESQEYKDAKLDLELDANKVKKSLMKELDSIEVPDPAKEEETQKAKLDELAKAWQPKLSNLPNENKITVTLPEDQGGKMELEIPKEEMQELSRNVAIYLLQNQIPVNDKSLSEARQVFIEERYKGKNFEKLVSHILTESLKKRDEDWNKKIQSPGPIKPNVSVPTKTGQTPEDKVAQILGF